MKEQRIQERFERETGCGHQQVPGGIIDILTPFELIEIKNWDNFDTGIGQLFRYGVYYPKHQKRLHCFGEIPKPEKFELYKLICQSNGIALSYETEELSIKTELLNNYQRVFAIITDIDHHLHLYNQRLDQLFDDHIRIGISNIGLMIEQCEGWDIVVRYDGYPQTFEPKTETTFSDLMTMFDGFEYKMEAWKFKLKVLGPTNLYIRIYTEGNVAEVVERMIAESKFLTLFEVALPILVVRDEVTKGMFECLFIGQHVFVYTVDELLANVEDLTEAMNLL